MRTTTTVCYADWVHNYDDEEVMENKWMSVPWLTLPISSLSWELLHLDARRTATKTRHNNMSQWKRLRCTQKTPSPKSSVASATLTNPIVAYDCHYKEFTPFISPWMPNEKCTKTAFWASSPGGMLIRQNTMVTIFRPTNLISRRPICRKIALGDQRTRYGVFPFCWQKPKHPILNQKLNCVDYEKPFEADGFQGTKDLG